MDSLMLILIAIIIGMCIIVGIYINYYNTRKHFASF